MMCPLYSSRRADLMSRVDSGNVEDAVDARESAGNCPMIHTARNPPAIRSGMGNRRGGYRRIHSVPTSERGRKVETMV
jgi:hypothetical protein